MKKELNRRGFLKSMGFMVAGGFANLPLTGWSNGLSSLLSTGLNPANEFSLLKLNEILPGYEFPFISDYSTSHFTNSYSHYLSLRGKVVYSGPLELSSIIENETRKFDFFSWNLANTGIKDKQPQVQYRYFLTGNMNCKDDLTLTPKDWMVHSRIAVRETWEAYANTGIINDGEFSDNQITLYKSTNPVVKQVDTESSLSWKWGLIAMVQHMAENSVRELQFSMLDEFDMILHNQKMIYSKLIVLNCGDNQLIPFKVYTHLGKGIIPSVYYVDNYNRVIFIVSGMEAFVLDESTSISGIKNPRDSEIKVKASPVLSELAVEGLKDEIYAYRIHDIYGKVIISGESFRNGMNVMFLNSGIYFLNLDRGNHSRILKFLKA